MTRFALDDAGTGPPVLLLHGFPTTRRLWKDVSPRLVSAGLRVIAPDLLGYGDSPGAGNVGMKAQAVALLELLEELGVQRAAVVAHDVGTAAAEILTVRAPERVRRLVLMDGVHETEWAMGAVESIRSWDPQLIHAARCLDPQETAGITARLRATAVPVRVIWGTSDAYLPLETVGRPLADALGARITVLPGGHFLPLDNPEGVAAELLLEA